MSLSIYIYIYSIPNLDTHSQTLPFDPQLQTPINPQILKVFHGDYLGEEASGRRKLRSPTLDPINSQILKVFHGEYLVEVSGKRMPLSICVDDGERVIKKKTNSECTF